MKLVTFNADHIVTMVLHIQAFAFVTKTGQGLAVIRHAQQHSHTNTAKLEIIVQSSLKLSLTRSLSVVCHPNR